MLRSPSFGSRSHRPNEGTRSFLPVVRWSIPTDGLQTSSRTTSVHKITGCSRVPVARLPDGGSTVPHHASQVGEDRRDLSANTTRRCARRCHGRARERHLFRDSRLILRFRKRNPGVGEMNYTQDKFATLLRLHVAPSKLRGRLAERLENVTIHRGRHRSAFHGTVYPNTPGLDGATINAQGVTIAYDNRTPRRSRITPSGRPTRSSPKLLVARYRTSNTASSSATSCRFVNGSCSPPLCPRLPHQRESSTVYEQNSIGGVKSLRVRRESIRRCQSLFQHRELNDGAAAPVVRRHDGVGGGAIHRRWPGLQFESTYPSMSWHFVEG